MRNPDANSMRNKKQHGRVNQAIISQSMRLQLVIIWVTYKASVDLNPNPLESTWIHLPVGLNPLGETCNFCELVDFGGFKLWIGLGIQLRKVISSLQVDYQGHLATYLVTDFKQVLFPILPS